MTSDLTALTMTDRPSFPDRPRVVVLAGDTGSGKSRLASAYARKHLAGGGVVLIISMFGELDKHPYVNMGEQPLTRWGLTDTAHTHNAALVGIDGRELQETIHNPTLVGHVLAGLFSLWTRNRDDRPALIIIDDLNTARLNRIGARALIDGARTLLGDGRAGDTYILVTQLLMDLTDMRDQRRNALTNVISDELAVLTGLESTITDIWFFDHAGAATTDVPLVTDLPLVRFFGRADNLTRDFKTIVGLRAPGDSRWPTLICLRKPVAYPDGWR